LRFFPDKPSEIPAQVALWRVAPGVRFNALAIFTGGSLRAITLRVRISSLAKRVSLFSIQTLPFAG
jgi:hypothetical protein